jgi:tRNA 2-thiouridine synthesizing protein E
MSASQEVLQVFTRNGRGVEVDEDGFIQQPELWDAELALALARTDGIEELTEAHWKIIHYMRNYFEEFETAPMIRTLCNEAGCSLREIYDLFPSGPAKGACRVAGLPKPTSCV